MPVKPELERADLESLSGTRLESYLRNNGWAETDREPEFSVWNRKARDGRVYEVLVPLDASFADYAERMDDALQTLVVVEHRTSREVLATLKTGLIDRFRARLVTVGERTTLPLAVGVAAFQGVRDLLLAAALAEDHGALPYYATPKRQRVVQLLRGAELDQTAEGSFVINVSMRLPRTLFPHAEPPKERRLLARLAGALSAVQAAADEATDTAYFSQVSAGVSANLCAALGRTSITDRIRSVEFGWEWAGDVASESLPQSLSFSHEAIRRIGAAGKVLRKVNPQQYVVLGRVKTLHHQEADSGFVTVEESGGRAVSRVRIFLAGEEHQAAIRAYRSQEQVTCTGELLKRGREGSLMGAKGFRIVEAASSS